ncbi:helix-turn-helix transcriptional regulator [Providencia rettgeri]|uniref:helix-turn-helix domain-containing protein n=1 Tax=Providencia TaxID=586 RepID=UPI0005B4597B|nr:MULTISPECIES: helix-turn-helix transcriptional regulator [Providencia]APC10003.1 anaerobic benzoate catabolism transcriptional regulator [Providencia rettgeri]AVL73648.1 XRE family transcriptional regulator [Providencia rettgeri]EIU7557854.1 helix-turn-helix transcriptional regulator [Providencia rettgeri]EJD6508309.1 helix-turn-helix transcriptional regulator [Providencia rettgeri]EJD6539995.1 helix-turn-helix transcriptional regulator [Providencia rettgeri]
MKRKISKSVGLKIRVLREANGMSGKELSSLLGISQQHQSRYENGEVNIHVDTIYQLSQIFNIDPAYFLTDETEINKNTDTPLSKKNYFSAEALVF